MKIFTAIVAVLSIITVVTLAQRDTNYTASFSCTQEILNQNIYNAGQPCSN